MLKKICCSGSIISLFIILFLLLTQGFIKSTYLMERALDPHCRSLWMIKHKEIAWMLDNKPMTCILSKLGKI